MNRVILLALSILTLTGCKKTHSDGVIDPTVLVQVEKYDTLSRSEIICYFKHENVLRPALLFVHGGGWLSGSYSDYLTPQIINWAIHSDFQLFAINYSLSPSHIDITNKNRIKHPAHVRDVARSVRWLIDNAEKYGVDKRMIFLIGHSAGALLVDVLGTNQKYMGEVGLTLKNLAGVISLDGGAYLTNEDWLMFPADNDPTVDKEYIRLKQCYYNAFTTDAKYYSDACPYLFIQDGKGIPPFLFVSQQESVIYRSRPNKMMCAKMIANNIDATHYLAATSDHMQTLWSIGLYEDKLGVANAIKQFIVSHKH